MKEFVSTLNVHLIGIGGTGMRAVAAMLVRCGAKVSGSDLADSEALNQLRGLGVEIFIGQRAENINPQCNRVVYSAAVKQENPEMIAAASRGIQTLRYSAMLGELMQRRKGISIAGTHGKSTTSAMVSFAMQHCGLDPSFIVGADVQQLGGPSRVGNGEHFVAEACEFGRSFLDLSSQIAVILNVEEDHLDCYSDLAEIIEAFRSFSARVAPGGLLVINGDDRNAASAAQNAACEVQSFGLGDHCDWRAKNVRLDGGCYHYTAQYKGEDFAEVALKIAGMHNVYNSLAGCAILKSVGVDGRLAGEALSGFTGAGRRMTEMGSFNGATVVDDYAHHPTEIQVTLKALRQRYSPKRVFCVFQPHQHSRTRFLLGDFARSFSAADEVIVPDIYFVRDSAREMDYISAGDLVSQIRLQGGEALYLENFDSIVDYLYEQLAPGDLIVTMGAGNVWEIADGIICRHKNGN